MSVGQNQFLSMTGMLQQSAAKLGKLEAMMRWDPMEKVSPDVWQRRNEFSREVATMRKEHNEIAGQYSVMFRAIYGEQPEGVYLGALPALLPIALFAARVAIYAGTFILLYRTLTVLLEREARLMVNARTMEKAQDNAAELFQLADDAEARGDTTTAQQHREAAMKIMNQTTLPGGGAPAAAGVGGLLVPLGLLAAGVFVLPRIMNAFRG